MRLLVPRCPEWLPIFISVHFRLTSCIASVLMSFSFLVCHLSFFILSFQPFLTTFVSLHYLVVCTFLVYSALRSISRSVSRSLTECSQFNVISGQTDPKMPMTGSVWPFDHWPQLNVLRICMTCSLLFSLLKTVSTVFVHTVKVSVFFVFFWHRLSLNGEKNQKKNQTFFKTSSFVYHKRNFADL